jgi:hypothetical protein
MISEISIKSSNLCIYLVGRTAAHNIVVNTVKSIEHNYLQFVFLLSSAAGSKTKNHHC